jgi:hypothetical protein
MSILLIGLSLQLISNAAIKAEAAASLLITRGLLKEDVAILTPDDTIPHIPYFIFSFGPIIHICLSELGSFITDPMEL